MHIYPLRSSRNYWKIPLYCCHECTTVCQNKFTVNSEGNIDIIPNPHFNPITKKCNKHDTLRPATIPIYNFNVQEPAGMEGKLYYPDLVVIPDQSFSISITFPLTHGVEVGIYSETPVTLRELIYLIKQVYIQIYEDEEKTADSTIFTITRTCDCIDTNLKDKVTTMIINETTGSGNCINSIDCSVCYMALENEVVKLSCNHLFHKECLFCWIDKGNGLSCPLCRTAIHNCDQCHNTQSITTEEEYVVLPADLREISIDRNTTNGLYGIYSHDLENLYITEMQYNRVLKILQVVIKF